MNIQGKQMHKQYWTNKVVGFCQNGTNNNNTVNNKLDPLIIYFRFPYYNDKRVSLIKSCIRTTKAHCLKDWPTVVRLVYDVTKMEFFCNTSFTKPFPVSSQ